MEVRRSITLIWNDLSPRRRCVSAMPIRMEAVSAYIGAISSVLWSMASWKCQPIQPTPADRTPLKWRWNCFWATRRQGNTR